jgi:hypothetical protein
MPSPGEYKTVQARILAYAQQIGWTYVPPAKRSGGARSIPLRPRPPSRQPRCRPTSTTCSMRKCAG